MFKMASFGFNTFTEAFSKVADDGRALLNGNFVPSTGCPKNPRNFV